MVSTTTLCSSAWDASSAGVGGVWVLKLRLQRSDPGKRLGLAAQRQPEGVGVWCNCNWMCMWKKPRPNRGTRYSCQRECKGRSGTYIGASFWTCTYSEVTGHHLHELWGWARGAVITGSKGVHRPLQRCVERPASRWQSLPPLAQALGVCAGLCIYTPPIKGIIVSTHWGMRQQASKLKAALVPKILNPHKLCRDSPACK